MACEGLREWLLARALALGPEERMEAAQTTGGVREWEEREKGQWKEKGEKGREGKEAEGETRRRGWIGKRYSCDGSNAPRHFARDLASSVSDAEGR